MNDNKEDVMFLVGLTYIALSIFVSVAVGLIAGKVVGFITLAGFGIFAVTFLL